MKHASENFPCHRRRMPCHGDCDFSDGCEMVKPTRDSALPPGAGIVIAVIVAAAGWALLLALIAGPRT